MKRNRPPDNVHRRAMMASQYAFAQAQVIALRHNVHGIPLGVVGTDGVPLAMAFTEFDAARSRIPADVHATPLQLPMHQLVRLLPEGWGVIVDVDRPHPQVVSPADKLQVINDSGLFPVGAPVTLAPPGRQEASLVKALRERTVGAAGVTRVWVVRHQVDDLPIDVLVVVEADAPDAALRLSDAVYEVSRSMDHPTAVVTASIDELPVDHALWVRQQTTTWETS